jgi:hypothetical protein
VRLIAKVRMVVLAGMVLAPVALFSQDEVAVKSTKAAPISYKTTIQGLVRDIYCPMKNHQSTSTEFNLECALECAKSGSPLVILTKSGDMYFPMSDEMPDESQREKMLPWVGKQVLVKGTVYHRNGTRAIVIESITEAKGVKAQSDLK